MPSTSWGLGDMAASSSSSMPERAGLPCRPRTSSFGTLVAVSTVLVVLTAPTCASRWQADTSELTEQNGLGRKTTAVGNSETRQQESKGPSGRKLQTRHPYFYPLSDWSMDLNPPSRWKSRPASTRPSQPWNLFRHAVSVSNGRDVLPTLTPRAAAFRRVLIVGLVGGVCSNDDWRGDLPKYIMKFLPEARSILLNLGNCRFEDGIVTADHVDCEECTYNGRWSVDRHRDCQYYLDPKKLQPADLLIVLGSGESQQHLQEEGNTNRPERDLLKERQWPALLTLFNSGLIDHQTMSVHVPIRRNTNLQKMFYFHHKIYDGDFLKPLSMQSLKEMEIICSKEPKVKDLIYVGRYKEDKGQLQFLEMVDAGDIAGYTVHFYGSALYNDGYMDRIKATAKAKKISAVVHDPEEKHVVLRHYCRASGMIHYARMDDNPRAPYEGLSAGTPLFASYESLLHETVYAQPFVTSISYQENDPAAFRSRFGQFMSHVRDVEQLKPEMQVFIQQHLTPESIYRKICAEMGICE